MTLAGAMLLVIVHLLPVWLPALAVGWAVGLWCCGAWRGKR